VPEGVRVGHVLLVRKLDRGAHPVDVGAGGEALALAGEEDCPCAARIDERLRELCDQRRVECVPPVGPGQRDSEDRPVPLHPECAHGAAA
jgi:hypothetical protein